MLPQPGAGSEFARPARAGLTEGGAAIPRPGFRWPWLVAASVVVAAFAVAGGVGVNEAFNVASAHDATEGATASAYAIGNQLLTTVWNFVLAAVLVAAAFGRSGGKRLIEASSAKARELEAHDNEASSGAA